MAIVLFASSNCCLRWSICTFKKPSSLVVESAFPVFPVSTSVSIPILPVSVPLVYCVASRVASRVGWRLALGITRGVDPFGVFPGVVVEEAGRPLVSAWSWTRAVVAVAAAVAAAVVLGRAPLAVASSSVLVGTIFLVASSSSSSSIVSLVVGRLAVSLCLG